MTFRRILAVFVLALCLAAGAYAAQPSADDIKGALATPSAALKKLDLPDNDLETIYAGRDDKPAWNFIGPENASSAGAFIASLQQYIDYNGLDGGDYPLDAMRSLVAGGEDNRAELDLLVTGSLLRLAHDLHGDTISLEDDYPGWNFERNDIDIPKLLIPALEHGGADEFISGLVPKNPAYAKLAEALRKYRGYAAKGGWPTVDTGPSLRPHDHGHRVAQLRARLAAEDYIDADPTNDVFGDKLEKALIAYQLRNGLEPDGHGGPRTVESLDVSVDKRIEQIRANMERWRHIPDDFPPDRYIAVNIASASIRIIEGGKEVYAGPVVIGKVDRKTPFIQSRVRSMIVNPSWHVPAKIAKKDILPKLRKDPHYLEKLGFVISGNENDPHGNNIDWASMPDQEFNYRLRQEPGNKNSLGHIKFDFDNDFAVYMHGTPHQELFAKAQRNESSGCIRLRDPEVVGERILQGTPGHWDADKIQDAVASGKTRWVAISDPMPLYVLYWTVMIDPETGAIDFRKDAYDYDRILEPGYSPPDEEQKPASP